MNNIEAKVVKKVGEGVRGTIYFEAKSATRITEAQAMEAQRRMGYHPAGYSFENFKVKDDPVLFTYKATWTCWAGCD